MCDHGTCGNGSRVEVVGVELNMADRAVADDVLVHSEDEGEWEDEAEVVERRPRGTQVVSARLPVALAQQLLSEAARRGIKPSDLVREAMDEHLNQPYRETGSITAFAGQRMQLHQLFVSYATENPIVTEEPPNFVALGAVTSA